MQCVPPQWRHKILGGLQVAIFLVGVVGVRSQAQAHMDTLTFIAMHGDKTVTCSSSGKLRGWLVQILLHDVQCLCCLP